MHRRQRRTLVPLCHSRNIILHAAGLNRTSHVIALLAHDRNGVQTITGNIHHIGSQFNKQLRPFVQISILVTAKQALSIISRTRSVSTCTTRVYTSCKTCNVTGIVIRATSGLISTRKRQTITRCHLLINKLGTLTHRTRPTTTVKRSCILHTLTLTK